MKKTGVSCLIMLSTLGVVMLANQPQADAKVTTPNTLQVADHAPPPGIMKFTNTQSAYSIDAKATQHSTIDSFKHTSGAADITNVGASILRSPPSHAIARRDRLATAVMKTHNTNYAYVTHATGADADPPSMSRPLLDYPLLA
jgi:hypothetical protein